MLKWGIVGSGYVARKFVAALKNSKDSKGVAVFSRSERNAAAFANRFGIEKVFTSAELLFESAEVDVVYIATPPSSHCELAIKALDNKKPAIIEKPLAMSRAEAELIAEASARNKTFCMEAMWTRFTPLMKHLRELISTNAIGQLRSIEGSFGGSNIPGENDNRFSSSLGGGALYHRGVYPLSIALDLAGPASFGGAVALKGESGVDEDSVVIIKHESGVITTIRSSLRAMQANDIWLEGTHGCIHVHAPIFRPFRLSKYKCRPTTMGHGRYSRLDAARESSVLHTLRQLSDPILSMIGKKNAWSLYSGNGYVHEIAEVANCLKLGLTESTIMPLSSSINAAEIVDQAINTWNNR